MTPELVAVLIAALGSGLLGSVHCAAMCGPLVAAGCTRDGGTRIAGDAWQYYLGRLVSYATVGAVCGHLGRHALCILPMHTVESVAVGVVAAAAAARGIWLLFERAPAERPIPLRRGPGSRGGGLLRRILGAVEVAFGKPFGALFAGRALPLGLVTGVLPCGALVPAWMLAASTGSAPQGAAAMAAFSLASAPGLVVPLLGPRLGARLLGRLPRKGYGGLWLLLAAWLGLRLVLGLRGGGCH